MKSSVLEDHLANASDGYHPRFRIQVAASKSKVHTYVLYSVPKEALHVFHTLWVWVALPEADVYPEDFQYRYDGNREVVGTLCRLYLLN